METINILSKQLNAKITTRQPDNSFGGYSDGNPRIWHDLKDKTFYYVTTCRRCGDGTWTELKIK